MILGYNNMTMNMLARLIKEGKFVAMIDLSPTVYIVEDHSFSMPTCVDVTTGHRVIYVPEAENAIDGSIDSWIPTVDISDIDDEYLIDEMITEVNVVMETYKKDLMGNKL